MDDITYVSIWTDGGARGNPGPAGIGAVIVKIDRHDDHVHETMIHEIAEYIGQTTNNQAEYQALVAALVWLQENSPYAPEKTVLALFTDSELMAYQVQGKYKVKNVELKPLHEKIHQILRTYKSYTITPIRREKNQLADKLVNQALDTAYSQSGH